MNDQGDPDALPSRLAALRRDGAARVDPARWRFLEALSRRMAGQPDAVRAVLQATLQSALADCAEAVRQAKPGAGAAPAVPVHRIAARSAPEPLSAPRGTPSPLARLHQSILAARAQAASGEEGGDPDELASAARFRRTWTRLRIQDQVDEAVARKPANAGPLNSHVLVLQSLDLMRELSPRYLERFMAHVEALQWLEAAGLKAAEPQGRQAKAAKAAKPARPRK